MYKILVNHKIFSDSPKAGEIWHSYGITTTSTTTTNSSSTEFKEFETDDIDILREEVEKLDKLYGHDYIRIISDVTYDVLVDVKEETDASDLEVVTSEDINNIYNTAYANVFAEGGGN